MSDVVPLPRILLVEDNPGDVYLVRQAFEEHGFTCQLDVLRDGEEALRFIENLDRDEDAACPHALLLDLNLPKWGGEQILSRLRTSTKCADTPVIVLTSSDSPVDRARANGFGVKHYFRKPNDLEEFLKLGMLVKNLSSPPPNTSC